MTLPNSPSMRTYVSCVDIDKQPELNPNLLIHQEIQCPVQTCPGRMPSRHITHRFRKLPTLWHNLSNALAELQLKDPAALDRPTSKHRLSSSSQKTLLDLLDEKLSTISDFLEPGAEQATSTSGWPSVLLAKLHLHINETEEAEANVKNMVVSLQGLAEEISQLHPELQRELVEAISTIPPALNARQAVSAELLAATIETCLIKLSLMRARCHQTLYGFKSSNNPENTMQKALTTAYSKLRNEADDLEEEDGYLDQQLEEYENLMQLVDGSESGFGQLVEDWVYVAEGDRGMS
ncbi:hypothetical protein D9758_015500 [Tetrapyrgos nigripes]|uniref:Uncharacterized protein n=1 Tax=Tetrapyrgos nigripes TaxID=182062 RepID=A0A8H5BYQ0_9AGAR|nr:hypothetical protein D9758_015500 [Tetrapyrgos nigripes]